MCLVISLKYATFSLWFQGCTILSTQKRLLLITGSVLLFMQVNGSLWAASVISVYCAYACSVGVAVEPRADACNCLTNPKVVTAAALILEKGTNVLSNLYPMPQHLSIRLLPHMFPAIRPGTCIFSVLSTTIQCSSTLALTRTNDKGPRRNAAGSYPLFYIYNMGQWTVPNCQSPSLYIKIILSWVSPFFWAYNSAWTWPSRLINGF